MKKLRKCGMGSKTGNEKKMEEKQMDTLTLWVDELETEDFEEGVLGESKVAVPIAGNGDGAIRDPLPYQTFVGWKKIKC